MNGSQTLAWAVNASDKLKKSDQDIGIMKMQLPLAFRAMLLLYLFALLLGVDGSSGKRCKKHRRCKGSDTGRKSRGSKKGLWVSLDSTLNISTLIPPSPSRSLSPWTYVTSYDDSRIPMQISEAKCERRGCLMKNGEEDLGLESQPIQYQIHVLRKVKDKNKRYTLKLESKVITVGCTCVLPVVFPQK
ncbi:interleukin 17a/f3 precursor [Triplophysa rosa]|uniref:Interleukin 17a/f3 n=2 Tax=Triplophysa rosa TaxID=992332 RepID=A0A9W7TIH8_TRIRA|nr:interleukin 17a/f3 precursor [Triplophysa rosa]